MGLGQCPVCEGCAPGTGWVTNRVGHRLDCPHAAAMRVLGMVPEMDQPNPKDWWLRGTRTGA